MASTCFVAGALYFLACAYESENNRRAKIYTITPKGARRLGVERRDWQDFVRAMRWVLESADLRRATS